MEALIELGLLLAKRPETGIFGVIAILLSVATIRLGGLLIESRARNIQLETDYKMLQQKQIDSMQENAKVLERNSAANNAVANMLQSFVSSFLANRGR